MADPHEALHEALADKYELLDVLGEGGMGTVYLARDLKHNRKVAVQTIHPEDDLRRFDILAPRVSHARLDLHPIRH